MTLECIRGRLGRDSPLERGQLAQRNTESGLRIGRMVKGRGFHEINGLFNQDLFLLLYNGAP